MASAPENWQSTACILCSLNCGIQVQTEQGKLTKIRGDKAHPISQGYLCQKAGRLDFYQNHAQRLDSPLKRVDGKLVPISWEQAIEEIARKLKQIRDTHGGEAIAYAGGGGQGNHLGGIYGAALRAGLRTPYYYSALAQEKTGDFWVNGKLFGKQTCHLTEEVETAEFVLFIGTNPWQSHGIPRARKTLLDLSKDPNRTMVVIDPRRTETAKLAKVHLALRPGTDALLLSALLGVIFQSGWEDGEFLARHAVDVEAVRAVFRAVPIDAYCHAAGVDATQAREVARGFAHARSACVRVDLGLQQTRNSTLNSYLEKLLFLVTGNFGKAGGNNPHTFLLPLIGHSGYAENGETVCRTQVTGMTEIGKLFPPNILAAEIDSDHPRRTRALVSDSCNPLRTYADTAALTRAFAKLELSVTIDVALTETAKHSDYVLPAASQYEKWEATFFNLSFPTNFFHLRKPLFAARPGTLPEPEIYRRLLVALGELPARFPVLRAIARVDRLLPALRLFPLALGLTLKRRPRWIPYATLLLHETLGAALADGARAAAPLWYAAHRYAKRHAAAVARVGVRGGESLFRRILRGHSGVTISRHTHDDAFAFLGYRDRKIRLAIPELLARIGTLAEDHRAEEMARAEFPFVLIAGDRRSYNAGAILRPPQWRKDDAEGRLKIHPDDAAALDLADGDAAVLESRGGSLTTRVWLTDEVPRGMLSMPTGFGMSYPDGDAERVVGPEANRLTVADHCDPITKTPLHKNVPVRLRRLL